MDLGTFSVSLPVQDLKASRAFYEKLGFEMVPKAGAGGSWDSYEDNWVILRNDNAIIGLFQGMFDKITMTFNPTDVRGIQKQLKESGLELMMEADESTTGPAFAMLQDPDGNPVLLDQHND